MEAAADGIPETGGEGDHEQPLVLGMLQGMQVLSLAVADLQGVVYKQWKGPPGWRYVTQAVEYRKAYGKRCVEVAGKGVKLGAAKNWAMFGLFKAYMEDDGNRLEDKKRMSELVGKHYRNREGNLDIALAAQAAKVTGHVEVNDAKHAAYITYQARGPDAKEILALFEKAWAKEGEEQMDPPLPKPVLRDLRRAERAGRDALMQAKGKGRGKGGRG